MFALEIFFADGVSQPETILIRRPQAVVGASDFAHVVVEDMRPLEYQLRVVRDVGRKFRCIPVGAEQNAQVWRLFEGVYVGEASFDLGPVRLHLTALDYDMLVKESEPPDRAGVRTLRQACAMPSPLFPALVVLGANPMVVSFVPDQPILIGRSKKCALRLDSADISGEHARVGYESGNFWIEDLGSTNGTFVRQQQVAGRVVVAPGEHVILGREVCVMGVTSEDQIRRGTKVTGEEYRKAPVAEARYPALCATSELVRPSRLLLTPGSNIDIGRDPGSDIWLGAPHVSRRHCSVEMTKRGTLIVTDHSMNGTAYDGGILKNEESIEVSGDSRVFDFGGGVTVALCLKAQDEQTFTASGGSLYAFSTRSDVVPQGASQPSVLSELAPHTESQPSDEEPSVGMGRFGRIVRELYEADGIRGKITLLLAFVCVLFLVLILGSLLLNWKM